MLEEIASLNRFDESLKIKHFAGLAEMEDFRDIFIAVLELKQAATNLEVSGIQLLDLLLAYPYTPSF